MRASLLSRYEFLCTATATYLKPASGLFGGGVSQVQKDQMLPVLRKVG
jgi:hypothetical protein